MGVRWTAVAAALVVSSATGCSDPTEPRPGCAPPRELIEGVCVHGDGVDPSDVLDALGPCEPVSADGSIDIANACVAGACFGMMYEEINDALGQIGACEGTHPDQALCAWDAIGIAAYYPDAHDDGHPDAFSGAWRIVVAAPFAGRHRGRARRRSDPSLLRGCPRAAILADRSRRGERRGDDVRLA
jgi:hypothetical protein